MAHERSISVEVDGKTFLIPTVVGGKKLSPKQATRLFSLGLIEPLEGPFSSTAEADTASKRRSRSGVRDTRANRLIEALF